MSSSTELIGAEDLLGVFFCSEELLDCRLSLAFPTEILLELGLLPPAEDEEVALFEAELRMEVFGLRVSEAAAVSFMYRISGLPLSRLSLLPLSLDSSLMEVKEPLDFNEPERGGPWIESEASL